MADERYDGDALRWFLTGADCDGGYQDDPDASLGAFRSCVEVAGMGHLLSDAIRGLRVEYASAANGAGTGVLAALDANRVAWTPPDGTAGDAVRIAQGETKVVGGGSAPGKFVRVTRTGSGDLEGSAAVTLAEPVNSAVALDDVSAAETSAGDTEYRCIALRAGPGTVVDALKVWLGLLGTARAVDAAGYAGGAVSITVKTGTLADWPQAGYVLNVDVGEVMYYSSRTSTALTVAAVGRDIYDETLGGIGAGDAGDEDDVLRPIPGLRLGLDAPTAQPDGSFVDQTGAGEGAAPGGVTFYHPTAEDDAEVLEPGILGGGEIYGLWLERKIPASGTGLTVAAALARNLVRYSAAIVG